MKFPDLQLRTAYYTLLNGNVTLGADTIPVYDVVPVNASYPFIRLSTQNNSENPVKGFNDFNSTMIVDIATNFAGGFGGKRQSDLIAEQVYDLIMTARHNLLMTDFHNIDTNLSSSGTFEEEDGKFLILRKILTFTHILSEK